MTSGIYTVMRGCSVYALEVPSESAARIRAPYNRSVKAPLTKNSWTPILVTALVVRCTSMIQGFSRSIARSR